jgi:hypothetical protein
VPTPYGEISKIKGAVGQGVLRPDGTRSKAIAEVFWALVQGKDSDFAKAPGIRAHRRLTIISSSDELDDNLITYFVGQALAESLADTTINHIDEINWLPNLGNGVLLRRSPEGVRAFTTNDTRGSFLEETMECEWQEIDLDQPWPPTK